MSVDENSIFLNLDTYKAIAKVNVLVKIFKDIRLKKILSELIKH
jgi:hypothetical protein